MRTIWLVWGSGFCAVVSLVANVIFSISVAKKYGWESDLLHMSLFSFFPSGLNKFQMCLWRMDLILRWIGLGSGFIFIFIETAFFILRKG
jgi:hypothetical protein